MATPFLSVQTASSPNTYPVDNTNPLPVTSRDTALTPAAFSGAMTIAAGGSAQVLATAGEVSRGGVVYNPSSATVQGIGAAESLWINFVTTATATSGGTSMEILPGTTYPIPALATGISVIAATTGHKFSGWRQ